MWEKLQEIERRYEEMEGQMMESAVCGDLDRLHALNRAQKELLPLVETFRALKACQADRSAAEELAAEPEFRALAAAEIEQAEREMLHLEGKLKQLLLPGDPNDRKNVILELRAGAGGEEAALFARDLLRMYTMFSERQGWRVEEMNQSETELGGIKEAALLIEGAGAYARLKFESGVHRVQRVPQTESQGRIQTSTVTVAVLPEAKAVDVQIAPKDLQIDTFRSSGAGGQHVNKTESAIRITHLPTGLVVECQDERSQYKNKDRAMKILAARLLDAAQRSQSESIAAQRRSQVGTGERSERIRTYNFPQGRVTDHRIGFTLHKIDAVMNGALEEIVDALSAADYAERLKDSAAEQPETGTKKP